LEDALALGLAACLEREGTGFSGADLAPVFGFLLLRLLPIDPLAIFACFSPAWFFAADHILKNH
jgi:hypothetical protein